MAQHKTHRYLMKYAHSAGQDGSRVKKSTDQHARTHSPDMGMCCAIVNWVSPVPGGISMTKTSRGAHATCGHAKVRQRRENGLQTQSRVARPSSMQEGW